MRAGHLFAGIDGLGLGLERHGFDTVWFSENEDAPSRVLAHHYPDIPNHGDITTIDWTTVEPVDVLTGGFPCQDLSYAGKGAGIKEGTRSGLWFEYVRAIRALRPALVIVENVPALATRGLDIVLRDLHESGFDAEWSTLRASDVGAAHRRERLFIVAVAGDRDVRLRFRGSERPDQGTSGSADSTTADCTLVGRAARRSGAGQQPRDRGFTPSDSETPADCCGDGLVRGTEPHVGPHQPGQQPPRRRHPVGRVLDWREYGPAIRRWERTIRRPAPAPTVDGRLSPDFVEWHMGFPPGWTDILTRNQRLKALGNAVVPQVADVIGRWSVEIATGRVAA